MKLTNKNGITFRTRIVKYGEKYGRDDCLTNTGNTVIEFYDTRHGQFVTRYDINTLLGKDGYGRGEYPYGLDLDGGVPDWKLSAENMTDVLELLEKQEV